MSDYRTLSRYGESRVAAWVQRESWGYASGLELGCGVGVYTREMLTTKRAGVDGFLPYIEEARTIVANDGIQFFCGDMRAVDFYCDEQFYDFALFVDTLEHVTKEDGIRLLDRCQERFLKVAVFIPIGPHDQEPCDDNEMQRHLSTWYEEDFVRMGFTSFLAPHFHNTNPPDKQAAAFLSWVKP